MKQYSRLKPQGLRYVASSCGPSTKFIQIMPLAPKIPPPHNIKLTFSEYGHDAYQIIENAKEIN